MPPIYPNPPTHNHRNAAPGTAALFGLLKWQPFCKGVPATPFMEFNSLFSRLVLSEPPAVMGIFYVSALSNPAATCGYWALEMWLIKLKTWILNVLFKSIKIATGVWWLAIMDSSSKQAPGGTVLFKAASPIPTVPSSACPVTFGVWRHYLYTYWWPLLGHKFIHHCTPMSSMMSG